MNNPFEIGLPAFKHSEIKLIYDEDLDIAAEKLQTILKLPKGDIISDLSMVLDHTKERESDMEAYLAETDWEKHGDLVLHALSILSQTGDEKAFQLIEDFFRSDDETLNLWLGDLLTECSDWFLIPFLEDRGEALKNWVLDTKKHEFAAILPLAAMSQLYHHKESSRKYVTDWLSDLFMDLVAKRTSLSDEAFQLLSYVTNELIVLRQKQFLPIIAEIASEGGFDELLVGALRDVKKEINEPFDPERDKYKYFGMNIYSFYEKVKSMWESSEMDKQKLISNLSPLDESEEEYFGEEVQLKEKEEEEKLFSPMQQNLTKGETFRHSKPKLGRNDPCHCGSGKKYKKCCLNQDLAERRA